MATEFHEKSEIKSDHQSHQNIITIYFYTAKHSNTFRPEIHKEWFSNKERKETLQHYSCPLDCARKIDDEKYLLKIMVALL